MTAEAGFTCPRCGRTSYHPDDLVSGYCGACHEFTGDADRARVRFRVYVGGELRDEAWVSLGDPEFAERARAVGDRQMAIATAADGAGLLWHVEVYDPARPPGIAYARLGTDPGPMVIPIQISTEREDKP